MDSHASSQKAISISRALRVKVRFESRKAFLASCCVIVLAPWSRPLEVTLWNMARAMPRSEMPQCERKLRSSIAMNALVTFGGSVAASTGASITAPRRAIGVPSAAVSVIDGAAIGCSDLDKGAVIAR